MPVKARATAEGFTGSTDHKPHPLVRRHSSMQKAIWKAGPALIIVSIVLLAIGDAVR